MQARERQAEGLVGECRPSVATATRRVNTLARHFPFSTVAPYLSCEVVLAKSPGVIEELKKEESNDTLQAILKVSAKALGLIGVVIFGKSIYGYFSNSIRGGSFPWKPVLLGLGLTQAAYLQKRYSDAIDSVMPEAVREMMVAALAVGGLGMSAVLKVAYPGSDALIQKLLKGVALLGGTPLLLSTLGEVLEGKFHADVLAMFSLLGGVLLKEYLAAAVIVLMMSGGEVLEEFAVHKAGDSLHKLSDNIPSIVHRLDGPPTYGANANSPSWNVNDTPVERIKKGDYILVRPGEVFPLDGEVVYGEGLVNESTLTGEPLPKEKRMQDKIFSGSTNMESSFVIRVANDVKESTISKIKDQLEQAITRKGTLESLAEELASYFTPISIFIASMALMNVGPNNPQGWRAALSVFDAATPCPLLIAIPVAIVAGIAVAARNGLVVKSGAALENVSKIDIVVFDKTGTLTVGTPSVAGFTMAPDATLNGEEMLKVAASVERFSGHILAKGIVEYAVDKNRISLYPAEFVSGLKQIEGNGVEAKVNGAGAEVYDVAIGNARFMNSRGIAIPNGGLINNNNNNANDGKAGITTYVAINGRLQGWISFEDKLKEESLEVVKALREGNGSFPGVKRIIMLSGDAKEGVQKVADMLGIKEWYAECLPHEKSQIIEHLTKQGNVLFVGDGINDASSVAVAHVGVALGSSDGTKWTENVTSASSDVTIMSGDLRKVLKLLTLGHRVMRVARQSAIGGISLSVIAMIVATQGVVAPTVGAMIQEIIDVVTILNALRVVTFSL